MSYRDLGVGVGLRPRHYQHFLDEKPKSVNWVEVISENFMDWSDDRSLHSKDLLEKIRTQVPVALHGVSLSLGSADAINFDYLKKLRALVSRIEPVIVSDHLCWTGVDGENLHDLLPLPRTRDVVNHLVKRIDQVQSFLSRPILIENVSTYVEYSHNEFPEWWLLNELSRQTGCGILLDINNVYVNQVNHGLNAYEFLNHINLNHIGQIHLAGHSSKDGYIIDTHDEPVSEEVWDLYKYFTEKCGLYSAMIERDGNIPSFEELETELKMIQRIRDENRKPASAISASV